MAVEQMRLSPEFALVQALGTVPALHKAPAAGPYQDDEVKVAALQPKKDWSPPFCFYIPTEDEEDRDLDGPCGLQHFATQVHFVGGTHRGMQQLCQRAKKAIREMPGTVYMTPYNTEDWPRGSILVEDANLQQSSPDLYETGVGLYRRIYTVRLDYQTQEVFQDDD